MVHSAHCALTATVHFLRLLHWQQLRGGEAWDR